MPRAARAAARATSSTEPGVAADAKASSRRGKHTLERAAAKGSASGRWRQRKRPRRATGANGASRCARSLTCSSWYNRMGSLDYTAMMVFAGFPAYALGTKSGSSKGGAVVARVVSASERRECTWRLPARRSEDLQKVDSEARAPEGVKLAYRRVMGARNDRGHVSDS